MEKKKNNLSKNDAYLTADATIKKQHARSLKEVELNYLSDLEQSLDEFNVQDIKFILKNLDPILTQLHQRYLRVQDEVSKVDNRLLETKAYAQRTRKNNTTKAPAGYRLLKDPIVLTVKATFTNDRDNYVKGDGATEKTLQNLEALAHVKTFYSQIFEEKDETLTSDVAEGSFNLTVVNKVGKKLPVTGTSATLIIFMAGAGMMTYAVLRKKKKDTI